MDDNTSKIFIADAALYNIPHEAEGSFVRSDNIEYYKIANFDTLSPFFINIASSSNQWMFVSSSGGITAGRIDADNALFPYYTVDKITENYGSTGHKTVFLIEQAEKMLLWEPFSPFSLYRVERNLYKSIYGDAITFQEINHDLKLMFQYTWKTSEKYGFVLSAGIQYSGDNSVVLRTLSGIQNILPWGVSMDMQQRLSNLLDAYKLSELETSTELGIFGFSAKVTDLAEPSESLKATTVWQQGIEDARYLLSTSQLNRFCYTGEIEQETRVQGERGAFMVNGSFRLQSGDLKNWMIIAEVNQDHSSVIELKNQLSSHKENLFKSVELDCFAGTEKLKRIIGGADGLQLSGDEMSTVHHFANTLYNTMRGGTFYDNYLVHKTYLLRYLLANNKRIFDFLPGFKEELPEVTTLPELFRLAEKYDSPILNRLCRQYLPLYFSRRHGDPSRPWNKFAIQLREHDGTDKLDYQGNWRDIYQNWEALALSFPEYIESMIVRFLNATTADGYNPYRIHLSGVDWEKPNPSDPWSNIGYWNDHQIIYLQKLLELSLRFHPNTLLEMLNQDIFVHVNVPYRIKPYLEILSNPYETIDFDFQEDQIIEERVKKLGADGQLLSSKSDNIVYTTMIEKLVILLLAKLSNFIPGGGLWMNTQRPEWNDANNVLPGKGMSVVSVCYVRRYVSFLIDLLETKTDSSYSLSIEIMDWLKGLWSVIEENRKFLFSSFDKTTLKAFMNTAGMVADSYRQNLYRNGLSGELSKINGSELVSFFRLALDYLDHCIRANRREDGLYHSYNILTFHESGVEIHNLYEMLEGQVAVLSSGLLSPEESVEVLKALRHSEMYRKDQHSYILYPERFFPGFLQRNTFSEEDASQIKLISALVKANNSTLLMKDQDGNYHFNGSFHNVKDLKKALKTIQKDERFKKLAEKDESKLEDLFIRVFNHHEFTGRSGTIFGYEGLGSIYWHMVAKLLLATQEAAIKSQRTSPNTRQTDELVAAYYDVRSGLGFNKSPHVYGAFPTDPYSHTPAGKGAKQPGMTGQVKEEIITRLAEMGLSVENGEISFYPFLLRIEEFLEESTDFKYYDVNNIEKILRLQKRSLVFTFCQVPFVLKVSEKDQICIEWKEGSIEVIQGHTLPSEQSSSIFTRNGAIEKITVESSVLEASR